MSETAENGRAVGLARDESDEGLARTGGRLPAVDWGTALELIHKAPVVCIAIKIWVDGALPRNQGGASAPLIGAVFASSQSGNIHETD
jgi:hypothetical protein